jgi:hypothetical protein
VNRKQVVDFIVISNPAIASIEKRGTFYPEAVLDFICGDPIDTQPF